MEAQAPLVLADTSVWIAAQSRHPTPAALRLKALIDQGTQVCLTGLVLQELLQGARDESAFRKLLTLLKSRPRLESHNPRQWPVDAAYLYARCRWQGVTVRKSADCLIACIAIEHDVPLLHDDADFTHIASVEPRLKFA